MKARPAQSARRAQRAAPAAVAASAARTACEDAPGEEIATGSDPQDPLDDASELGDVVFSLAARRATAKGRARTSNTSLAAENSRLGFRLPARGG